MKNSVITFWVFLIIVVLLTWLLTSCNPVKKVLTDPKKKEIVGREWEKENPCVNDTFIKITPGQTVTNYDTAHEYHTDTLTDVQTQIKYITKYSTVIKTVTKTDTLRLTVEDVRRLQLAKDSIAYYHGVKDVLTNSVKEEKGKKNKWMLLFIGVCTLNAVIAYFKLRKGFVKLIPK